MGDINKPSSAFDTNKNLKPDATSPDAPKQKPQQKEKPVPYETVPEAPGIRRQLLFPKEFTLYQDLADASNRDVNSARKISGVPAIYTILDAAKNLGGKVMRIGYEDGRELGWVNIRESGAQEWNIRSVLLLNRITPSEPKTIPLYANKGDVQPIRNERLIHNSVLPVFESITDKNGSDWHKTIISFPGRSREKEDAIWVNGNPEHGVLATEKDLQDLSRKLKHIYEQLLPATREGLDDEELIKRILDTSQIVWMQFFGIRTGKDLEKNIAYVRREYKMLPRIFDQNEDTLQIMTNEDYLGWKQNFQIGIKKIDDILAHNTAGTFGEMQNHNRKEMMFVLTTNDF